MKYLGQQEPRCYGHMYRCDTTEIKWNSLVKENLKHFYFYFIILLLN